METVEFTLQLEKDVFDRVEREARKQHMDLGDAFRATIARGLPGLSSESEMERVIADTWEKLGPAPDVDYDKI